MADTTPLPAHIEAEIDQTQSRVWHLRNLIAAVAESMAEGAQGTFEDPLAAMIGLVEFADTIHNDLDAGEIARRAAGRQLEEQEAANG